MWSATTCPATVSGAVCRCAACGTSVRVPRPEGVGAPVQFGPRLAATAVYLQNAQFLPEERLSWVLRDLFPLET